MDTIINILGHSLSYTAPLLIIALGGLYSERSGIVNIGLEGLMGVGAFASAYFISINFESMGMTAIWLGLLIGALAGGLFSILHAFACINMKADQVISGTAINLLSAAVTVYLARLLTGSENIQIMSGIRKINGIYPTTYIVILIVILSWYIIYKTKFGLRLRACGENPQAADSMGIKVLKIRYIGVIISGLLSGLGGAIVVVTTSGQFGSTTYNGIGFLALAALIFGKWNPWGVLGAAFFFGTARTISNLSSLYESLSNLPDILLTTFPYVITIVALVIFSNNSAGPKAAGEPYDAGKR